MHSGSVIDELIQNVQSAELHALTFEEPAPRQESRAQAYSEFMYETWFKGHQTGVA
jgi:hypothetical protein